MLQAVVADDDVDLRMQPQQLLRCRDPIAADDDRCIEADAQQQRLVAGDACFRLRSDFEHAVVRAAIPARNDAGTVAT